MGKILGLFFGSARRATWSIGVFGLLGLALQVAPDATERVFGTIMAMVMAGFSLVLAGMMPFLLPIIMIAILWWMVRKLFGKK